MEKLITWVDIPVENFDRAVKFYSNLLKIELTIYDCGDEKMGCFPTGEGAISYAKDFRPSKDGTIVNFNMKNDLDAAIERAWESGGKVTIPKTKILAEGRGYFANIIDSEGNTIGLYGDE